MKPVGMGTMGATPPPQQAKIQDSGINRVEHSAPLKVEQNTVTLSEEGKALLAALKEIDKESKIAEQENKTVGDKVESFAHGALGMTHPDEEEKVEDTSYSAGQFLSTAATVGGFLLAII
jgi:hypothetical protein